MNFIPIYKLSTNYKSLVYNSGNWVDGCYMQRLTKQIKKYLGVKHVILTNNGTAALLAAYWVLRNEFKELYVDPYTFPATYQPAQILGYKINFIKTVLSKNFSLPKSGLKVITHLFGQPNRLVKKALKNNLIEDACQSFGAEIDGKKLGTLGKIGCFSFYPTKSLHTCGHGGAFVTNNDHYFQSAQIFINSGRVDGKITKNIALNLRMDEIKAEYLLKELKNYDNKIKIQINIANKFIKLIPINSRSFLTHGPKDKHIYSVFNILLKKNRCKFQSYMNNLGIETIVYYDEEILPQRERSKYKSITSSVVAIPCRWNLLAKEIKRIQNALERWFK